MSTNPIRNDIASSKRHLISRCKASLLGLSSTESRFSCRSYRNCQSARSCLPRIRRHIAGQVYDGYFDPRTRCSAVEQSTFERSCWIMDDDDHRQSLETDLLWLQSSVHGTTTSPDHAAQFECIFVDALPLRDHAMSAHGHMIVSLNSCHNTSGLACSQE
jgi:hypothetical protein